MTKKTRRDLIIEIAELAETLPKHRAPGDGSVSREVTATASAIARKVRKASTRD